MKTAVDASDVSRELRVQLWPALKALGFTVRTERVAWRHLDDAIDVVEVALVGPNAEAVGSTSFSFGAHVASVPGFLPADGLPVGRDGRPRPHYWQCELQETLSKTLGQPWFRPFAGPANPRLPGSFMRHREGLMRVFRRDTHDRADTWFVLADGSNLSETVSDLLGVVERDGLPLLERFHDPCAVAGLAREGALHMAADSFAGREIIQAAEAACRDA